MRAIILDSIGPFPGRSRTFGRFTAITGATPGEIRAVVARGGRVLEHGPDETTGGSLERDRNAARAFLGVPE